MVYVHAMCICCICNVQNVCVCARVRACVCACAFKSKCAYVFFMYTSSYISFTPVKIEITAIDQLEKLAQLSKDPENQMSKQLSSKHSKAMAPCCVKQSCVFPLDS